MRIVFMGSGAFAVPSLEALADSGHEIVAVVTQPDKPAGRGHAMTPPPTKRVALERRLRVEQPARLRDPEAVARIRDLAPELIVVAAYGQIVPVSILEAPPRGCINVHASLLPAYRGAAPIPWAILRGETTTGVTTMLMDEGVDTGPILLQREVPIAPTDTTGRLEAKLARVGASLLVETIEAWEAGRIEPRPQDDARASRAPRIRKEQARVDWTAPAETIERAIRAFDPWPVAFGRIGDRTVKIWAARPVEPGPGEPGTVLAVDERGVLVACGGGTRLLLLELQSEGRRRQPAAEWARGARVRAGDRWEPASDGPEPQFPSLSLDT